MGDVITVDVDDGYYTTLRIYYISADTLFFHPNLYMVDEQINDYTIDKDEYYDRSDYVQILRADYEQLYEEGLIYDVDR